MRITPAYAGKTNIRISEKLREEDHPRLRGKDKHGAGFDGAGVGSPPLTRERLRDSAHNFCHARITPAYAGKTRLKSKEREYKWDHPRLRGKDLTRKSLR